MRDFDKQCTVSQAMKWWVHCIDTLHSEQHCGLVVAIGYVSEVPSLNFGTSPGKMGKGGRCGGEGMLLIQLFDYVHRHEGQ